MGDEGVKKEAEGRHESRRGPGLVSVVPRLHPLRQGDLLPRRVAATGPPGASKHMDVRSFDIHEGDELDEAEMAAWVKQAAALPGWLPQPYSEGDSREQGEADRRAFSTPAWKATREGRLTSPKGRRSTLARSRRS